MLIGLLTIELHIPAISHKQTRQVLRSVQARLRNKFNVSVAEVDKQDEWRRGVVAVVCVSSDRNYIQGLLTKVIDMVETSRLDCALIDYEIELI
jgi:uncharacterized protein YlxP (DUF503 family)